MHNLVKRILFGVSLIGALSLGACATPQYNYAPDTETFSRPPLNTRVTASVGDEMVSQGKLIRQDVIEVPSGTQVSGYTFHGGLYPQVGEDEEHTFHGFVAGSGSTNQNGTLSKNFIVDPPKNIATKKNSDELCVITVFNAKTCRQRQFERKQVALEGDESFQQTLIYSGKSGDKINVSYREFSGDIARPAYSNDVEYDLSESIEIGYKGALLKVINATNTSITYEVIRNFNTN